MKFVTPPVIRSLCVLGPIQRSVVLAGIMILLNISSFGSTTYVSQNGGSFSGGSACNGKTTISESTFNSSKPSPGDQVYLCGVLANATGLYVGGSGTSGNPITITFDSGAKISVPYCNSICFNLGGQSYIVVDGGTPCGPSTLCSSTDTGTGIIEATGNGTGLANQFIPTQGIVSTGSNIEVRNLILRNMYQHKSFSDNTGGAGDISGWLWQGNEISLHDSTIHDVSAGFQGSGSGAKSSNVSVYNNYFWNINWGVSGGTASGQTNSNWSIHDNHFGSTANWDDSSNTYHHDRIFLYDTVAGQGNFSGVYIYNNLFDGASGCCATAQVYFGGGSEQDTYIFNNVFNNGGQSTGLANALLEETGGSSDTIWTYDNTIIGAGALVDTEDCVQLEGTVVFENNIVVGCNTLLLAKGDVTFTTIDYNSYGPSGTNAWQSSGGSSNYISLSAWQSFTKSEGHSQKVSNLDLTSSGVPETGSPVLQAGINLSSLCSGPLVALCSDTSAGDTRTPGSRPATGAWDAGSYEDPVDPPPVPPTGLSAVVQ
jgi:hypothetical protein